MPAVHPAALLEHIRRLAGGPPAGAVSDRELVRRYAARRDEDAFAALVQRHGPMVWRACRRLLRREQDAEDVFQATFLVLAKKAAGQCWQESIAGWLHGVATRLARKARSEAARRPAPAAVAAGVAADPLEGMSARELLAALDEELAALPEDYRGPLVLCGLEGRTQEEAARQLGRSLSTVRRRLECGRGLLHARLARRGLSLSAALGALLLARSAAPAAPAALLAAAGRGAAGASARSVLLADWLLGSAHALTWRAAAACVLAVGIIAGGVGLVAHQAAQAPAPPERAESPPKGDDKRPPTPEPAAAADDPLPAGALMRAGTTRFRHGTVVTSLAFSRDGKVIASGSWDATVRLWDAANGKELLALGQADGALPVPGLLARRQAPGGGRTRGRPAGRRDGPGGAAARRPAARQLRGRLRAGRADPGHRRARRAGATLGRRHG